MPYGERALVVGVGMTAFEKPSTRDWDYPDMAREAGAAALTDAGVSYEDMDQAVAGYCYGDSTSGQRALYELGLTGLPIYNVNNNCATGSTALFLARQLVEGGAAEAVLAVGFEKMERGSLGVKFTDRVAPMRNHLKRIFQLRGKGAAAPAPQVFGNAGLEHMERYGTTAEQFARVAVKNHLHSVDNPRAQFRDAYTVEEILASPHVHGPLTKLQCCPTSDGAAAAVVCSQTFARERGLEGRAVEIVAQAMATDFPDTFSGESCITIAGAEMTRAAALAAYEHSGLGPEDVDVIELHDCFSTNEVISYEALGLCAEGGGGRLIDAGATTYGGRWVVNPSGGLISKGHPLGATGLAQCAELVWQLRGEAGPRQVDGASTALQHNIGLGGAAVVTIYRRPTGPPFQSTRDGAAS